MVSNCFTHIGGSNGKMSLYTKVDVPIQTSQPCLSTRGYQSFMDPSAGFSWDWCIITIINALTEPSLVIHQYLAGKKTIPATANQTPSLTWRRIGIVTRRRILPRQIRVTGGLIYFGIIERNQGQNPIVYHHIHYLDSHLDPSYAIFRHAQSSVMIWSSQGHLPSRTSRTWKPRNKSHWVLPAHHSFWKRTCWPWSHTRFLNSPPKHVLEQNP